MGVRTAWLAVAALLALAGVAWLVRDQPAVRAWMGRASAASATVVQPAWSPALSNTRQPAATTGLRKCQRANGEVRYTDQACPGGTRAQAVGGQLTVVPGQPAPPAPAASLPHARDLLLQPNAADIQGQRIDAVIGK